MSSPPIYSVHFGDGQFGQSTTLVLPITGILDILYTWIVRDIDIVTFNEFGLQKGFISYLNPELEQLRAFWKFAIGLQPSVLPNINQVYGAQWRGRQVLPIGSQLFVGYEQTDPDGFAVSISGYRLNGSPIPPPFPE